MADFANLNLRFDSPDALAAWLATQPRPSWRPVGSTYHNTLKPTQADWRGHPTMTGMATHYASLGWTTGPHLFIALGTSADGIFVMTSPTQPGTHSPSCNGSVTKPGRFGIEIVGNYHTTPLSLGQMSLLAECAAVLHRWAGIGPDINAHRDCDPRTCPGNAAYAQKADIQALLAFAQQYPTPEPYTEMSPILGVTASSALTVAERVAGRPGQKYTPAEIRSIVATYYRICTPVGVNPLLAVAQMCHETGYLTSWWCDRPRRNAAGVGVTGQSRPATDPHPLPREVWHLDSVVGRWRHGCAFKSWEYESIPAHVGRLLRYALKPGTETPTQHLLMAQALGFRTLPEAYWGIAPTLRGLEGTWAVPGHTYADKIAAIANSLAARPIAEKGTS